MIPSELGPLSTAEQRVWDAFPRGAVVTLAADEPRTIRAAVIRSLLLGVRQPEPGYRAALRLHGAEVVGSLDLYQAEVVQAIELVGCTFDAIPNLSFASSYGVSFEGSTLPGLDAFGAVVKGSLSFVKCTFTGAVVIYGLHVSGDLDFDWAHLAPGGRPIEMFGGRMAAVFGDMVQVGRNLYLQGTKVTGNVELTGIRVAGSMHGQRGLQVEGELRLRGGDVTGEVNLTDGAVHNPGAVALDLSGLRAGQLSLMPRRIDGVVDLRHCRIGLLSDDPDHWPDEIRLDGATYTTLATVNPAHHRLRWLERDPDGYRPQPYEQLATMYRQVGHDSDARTVLLAKHRRRRQQLGRMGAAWGVLQDALVGYGYRPGRAAMWLLVLTAIGTTVFGMHPPPRQPYGTTFNALVYTLDLLVPVVDLGQEHAFGIAGPSQWLAYVLIVAGWILFSAVAAALTRTMNRS